MFFEDQKWYLRSLFRHYQCHKILLILKVIKILIPPSFSIEGASLAAGLFSRDEATINLSIYVGRSAGPSVSLVSGMHIFPSSRGCFYVLLVLLILILPVLPVLPNLLNSTICYFCLPYVLRHRGNVWYLNIDCFKLVCDVI